MVTISANDRPPIRSYRTAQFHYAMTYVAITAVVLVMLNLICTRLSQRLFYENKESAMIEKCQLASDELSTLDVWNNTTVSGVLSQLESLRASRLIVTDQTGLCIYDSTGAELGSYTLLPEILSACQGNDVFSWRYHDSAMISRASTPIVSGGSIAGCVYVAEYDNAQGAVIDQLLGTIARITVILELAVIVFSLAYSRHFSRRMSAILDSMHIIQQGNYTEKVNIGGNDELTVLASEFNDLTERLQTSEEKRRRFVSDASHELKTPLASIKLLTDSILQNDMDTETMREFVEDIGSEAERLNRMTAKLLSLTKVDSQEMPESELIHMAPTVQRVVRMLRPVGEKNNVTIVTHLEEDSTVLITEDDLYQIVFNLIENGIKYNSPPGSVTVTLGRTADGALLTVADTGTGIPPEALSHIFERFYRVDKARSRQTGGSGLGLAIVRAIVNRNRGEIQVDSAPGKGTTFIVTFPMFDTEVDDL